MTDMERWGIDHKSRVIEIAMDVYDHDLADRLQRSVRLTQDRCTTRPWSLGDGDAGWTVQRRES